MFSQPLRRNFLNSGSILILILIFNSPALAASLTVPAQVNAVADQTSTPEVTPVLRYQPSANLPFPDVNEGNSNYTAIYYLANQGIINGYPDGLFRPRNEINRAEALKILVRAIAYQSFSETQTPLNSTAEVKTSSAASCPFKDLDKSAWYYSYVCQAYQNHIIDGYPDGTFKPDQTINRIEAIKIGILESGVNYENPDYQTTIYNDTPDDQWFTGYAKFAKSTSIFPEDTGNNLYPAQTMNRGEFAGLVYRFIEFQKGRSEFGRASYYGPGLSGRGTASGAAFDASLLAAAHKTLPFGTEVKVTDLSDSKSVVVTINDRGPYVNGTVIDLTTAAFEALSSLGAGVLNVELEVLNTPENVD